MRSRCYAQNLQKYGFTISNSILITSESNSIKLGKTLKAPPYSNNYISGVFNADLSIPIEKSLKNLSKEIKTISSGTINCKIVEDYIIQQNPNLIIYSGFGGEIVSNQLIKIGVPFLHLHAGFLPTFRGSTTIYYSLLKTAKCGVSAIILSSNIDAGNIIATKYYDPPNCICNLDYEYDSAIRSNLLIEVLNKYYRNNYKLSSVSQEK